MGGLKGDDHLCFDEEKQLLGPGASQFWNAEMAILAK